MSYETILAELLAGNARFRSGRGQSSPPSEQLRRALAEGQAPKAVVLACADSRVSPEILFDQGMGELFVVRVAGNVASAEVSGSVEYAVAHLDVPLVVVMGHSGCGAVSAAADGDYHAGDIRAILASIRPSVYRATVAGVDDVVDLAGRLNTLHTVGELEGDDPVLSGAVRSGKTTIVPLFYDMTTGQVDRLDRETGERLR